MLTAGKNGWAVSIITEAVVLAGGLSQRFGSDKTMAPLEGRPMIVHVVEHLREARFAVSLSAGQTEKFKHFDCPLIVDSHPHAGPLYALRDILKACRSDRILVTAADEPFVPPEVFGHLAGQNSPHDVIVLADANNKIHPFPGIYSRCLLKKISWLIESGNTSLKSLLQCGISVCVLPWEKWKHLDPAGRALVNVNHTKDVLL